MPSLSGVIPILQTPFIESGEIDTLSLEAEVDYAIAQGASGVAFPGFASEWWKLSGIEIMTAARTIKARAAGRVPVIFNVTAQSTYLAVEQSREFASIGCDWLMCLPPFIMPPSADQALDHLKAILTAAPIPHILQYSTSLTGLKLSPDQLLELRTTYSHFQAIKVDTIPPGPMISRLRALPGGEGWSFLIGFSGLQLDDSVRRGARGLMGGAGHLAADVRALNALLTDPDGEGRRLFHKLLPIINFEMQTVDLSLAVHKQLLLDAGVFRTAAVRQPGTPLDPLQIEAVREHYRLLMI